MTGHAHLITNNGPRNNVDLKRDIDEELKNPVFRGALTSEIHPETGVVILPLNTTLETSPFHIMIWPSTTDRGATRSIKQSLECCYTREFNLAAFLGTAFCTLLARKYQAIWDDDHGGPQSTHEPIPLDPYGQGPFKGWLAKTCDHYTVTHTPALRRYLDESNGLVI